MGSVGVLGELCLEAHVSLTRISELFIAWRAILTNYLTTIDTSDKVIECHVVGVLVAGRGRCRPIKTQIFWPIKQV